MGERTFVKFFSRFSFLPLILFLLGLSFALAQDNETTPGTLQSNKKGLADIQKKIKEEKKKQRQDELKEKHVLNRIHRVDQKLHKLRRVKESNKIALKRTEAQGDQLQEQAEEKRAELERSRRMLAQRLRDLYRMSFQHPVLDGLLDSDNVADLSRKLKFSLMLARSNEKLLAQTVEDEARLKRDSARLQIEADQKQKMLVRLDQKEKNYDQEKKTRAAALEKIRQGKEEREKTIQKLTQSAHELQNKVAQIIREEAKAPKKRKVTKKVKATASAPATVVTVLEAVPEGKGLQVIRGRVPWPVSGKIISYFGKSKDPQFHLEVDNSGIQIQAPMGSPIHAVSAGVVKYADWFKGFGKLVILDHGRGYYSLYAQASELKVSEGDSVAAGQVLGLVGDTDSLVGSSLYFEIRKNGVPQDPLRWLKYRN